MQTTYPLVAHPLIPTAQSVIQILKTPKIQVPVPQPIIPVPQVIIPFPKPSPKIQNPKLQVINPRNEIIKTLNKDMIQTKDRMDDIEQDVNFLREQLIQQQEVIAQQQQLIEQMRNLMEQLRQEMLEKDERLLRLEQLEIPLTPPASPPPVVNLTVAKKKLDDIKTYGPNRISLEDLQGFTFEEVLILITRLAKNISTYKGKPDKATELAMMQENLVTLRYYRDHLKK